MCPLGFPILTHLLPLLSWSQNENHCSSLCLGKHFVRPQAQGFSVFYPCPTLRKME